MKKPKRDKFYDFHVNINHYGQGVSIETIDTILHPFFQHVEVEVDWSREDEET